MSDGLTRGDLLPSFSAECVNREGSVAFWDYKQRRNLALLFLRETGPQLKLLQTIAQHYPQYRELDSEVLVFSPEPRERLRASVAQVTLPFPVLADPGSQLKGTCLGSEEANEVALFADRWGEIYGRMELHPKKAQEEEPELRRWLEFINMQCGECFPPEWPAAD